MGRWLIFKGQPRPHDPKGRCRALPIWAVPFNLCAHKPFAEKYHITWGRACSLESALSHADPIERAELQLQGSPIIEVLPYLYLHPLTQNDQI